MLLLGIKIMDKKLKLARQIKINPDRDRTPSGESNNPALLKKKRKAEEVLFDSEMRRLMNEYDYT